MPFSLYLIALGAVLTVCHPLVAAADSTRQQGEAATDDAVPSQPEEVSAPTTVLDEVVISASKEGTSLRKTPAAINKINLKTLEEKKPTFVGQVLNQTPGVYVTDLGNEQHSMSIRQPLSYNAVYLYMEDGLPIRPVGLFNHNALYEVNLAGAGSVEVLKGPASSLYGSNAVGGSVNFFTRAPSAEPEGELGVQISQEGYKRVDVGLSGTSGSHGIRLMGYTSQRRGGWQDHNEADKHSLTLRHDLAVSAQANLKTILTYNKLDTDMPGSLNRPDYENRPGFSYNTFTWRKVAALRASTSLEGQWNQGGLSTLTAYIRNNTTDQLPSYLIFDNALNPALASGRTTNLHFHSIGVDAHHRQDFMNKSLRLIAGITGERSPTKGREENLSIVRDPATGRYTGFTTTGTRRNYEVDVQSAALYGQVEYAAHKDIRVVAGGRYDTIHYDYTNRHNQGPASRSDRYAHFSPKLGATWSFAKNTTLYGNISQGFTPPEVSAQYGSSLNADLRESQFNNIDTGIRWASADKTVQADIGVYRLTGKDEVVTYSQARGLSEPRNAGRTLHQGVEFGLAFKPRQTMWDAKLNGALSRHTYRAYSTGPGLTYDGKEIPAAPRWLANAEVGYKPLQPLRLSAEAQYIGRYWMDNANTVRYPGHALLNLRANYVHEAWEVWGSIMNITNKRYAEIAASTYSGTGAYTPAAQDSFTPGAPRTFLVGVKYHFGSR